MIKVCSLEHLSQCVEIAFRQNHQPEHNCAFCPKSKEGIQGDFEFLMENPHCLMVGYFCDDRLAAILGCFLNLDNHWVDCVGPFFKDEWEHECARNLFQFAKTALPKAVRFNFYFNEKNQNCHQLMAALSAERQDNEYILLLDRADYKPQQISHPVATYTSDYEAELIALHESTFPEVYVTGRDIVAAMNKTREVFCALDENGAFTGYGVLKYDDANHLTAEIFAVKKEKRGKGYGWALLNTVIDSAFHKHNGAAVDLVVDRLNTHARELYAACGFKVSVENAAYCLRVS